VLCRKVTELLKHYTSYKSLIAACKMAADKTSAQFYGEAILEETSGPSNVVGQTFYEPESAEAKALDRAVNLKLDFAILIVLAINFILCGIDKVKYHWQDIHITQLSCSLSFLRRTSAT